MNPYVAIFGSFETDAHYDPVNKLRAVQALESTIEYFSARGMPLRLRLSTGLLIDAERFRPGIVEQNRAFNFGTLECVLAIVIGGRFVDMPPVQYVSPGRVLFVRSTGGMAARSRVQPTWLHSRLPAEFLNTEEYTALIHEACKFLNLEFPVVVS